MDIIVRGEPQELDFVRRLCRDKVRRGLLAILPATSPACDEVVRLRKERDETKIEKKELMDGKDIEIEDCKEVNLNDIKTLNLDDTKDVQTDDVKETAPAKKTSKRSKKSE